MEDCKSLKNYKEKNKGEEKMKNLFLEHIRDFTMYEGLVTLIAYVIFVRISKEFDGIPPKIAEIIYAVGGTVFTALSLIYNKYRKKAAACSRADEFRFFYFFCFYFILKMANAMSISSNVDIV